MKKPPFVSHYLVLSLIDGKDVREKNDVIYYLTSRIENIKLDLTKEGLVFIEDITKETKHAHYKPYILVPTKDNLSKAEALLKRYATDDVLEFLESKQKVS
jgi:hypothetical protein